MGAEGGARVRAVAARIDARVVVDRVSLDLALAEVPELEARDLALVRALVFGARRWHHRFQWQLASLLTRQGQSLDPNVSALLRIGLFQLEALRVPDHAAVSETVAAAPLLGVARAKGLINAILRRYLRERDELERRQADAPEAYYSYPQWMIDLLKQDWPDEWESLLVAGNELPPMWLRVNLARTTRDEYRARLAAAGIEAAPGQRSSAALLLSRPCATSGLPGYAEGLVSVQDAAAQLAAGFLDLRPGQRVLDACAAPGGKSCHILESCPDLQELWALDLSPSRLETVQCNLDRLGLSARLTAADAGQTAQWWDGKHFDRILLDPPCSALGVIRRHPDIKLLRKRKDLGQSASRQAALLEALWPLLAPGGRLVYATCTLSNLENRDQIARFMSAHPDANVPEEPHMRGVAIGTGQANMDGFYYACINKQQRTCEAGVLPAIPREHEP